MEPNPFLGVFLHAVGGLAAGSFYLPFKKVKGWSWEVYWIIGGVFSWIVTPMAVAYSLNPRLFEIIANAPSRALLGTFGFGVLWGIGGLTFGLTVRYLGLSLGYALALGLCAAFGTLIPPLADGTLPGLFQDASGLTILSGVGVCLFGIALSGRAGMVKEKELSDEEKAETIQEFNFAKGVWVAIFCGIMSACMAFAFQAGKPIAELAISMGTSDIWQNTPVLVVILWGGFATNFLWCLFLIVKNKSGGEFTNFRDFPWLTNFIFSAIAGTVWYFQFFFYGMGTTKMGQFDFSSWTLHMAFIIVFSNLWGILLHEWKGTSARAKNLIVAGIVVLILSTIVVGYGNKLGQTSNAEPVETIEGL
ncbi:MAG: L-rhamnose/proton symporter RhaT [Candidatus Omnitrophica bacterium]|nr:L-rhamnose/proton symporter RhaT [Candidatus Omnitrophota bacterium]